METVIHFLSPPSRCGYLPDQLWSLEYEMVDRLTPAEYMDLMLQNWRRFGHMLFRPKCRHCQACRSLRVVADRFRPNRSQRRVRQTNEGEVTLVIDEPEVSRAKLNLYDRYHAFQAAHKDWPFHHPKDVESYCEAFVDNPFATEEWCYYLDDRLAGVGYVDALPAGLSAIYFYYDPECRDRSLGTWNVLRLIEECQRRGLPHLYLGYFVDRCESLSYKANFRPNQVLHPDGQWRDFWQ
jgi:arginine-tRNA-protein transferase